MRSSLRILKSLRKLNISLVLALILCCAISMTAFAHPVPDMDKKDCSISVTMHSGSTNVGGGALTLYRVGEVQEDDGNYSFEPTGDFASCGESFENIQSAGLAKALADYAATEKISGTTKNIDDKGNAKFDGLVPGLYLLVQNQSAEGYYKAEPFLVSVPYLENGVYKYNVDATPKVEVKKEPEATPTPTPTPTPSPTPTPPPGNPPVKTPTVPSKPTLPQTGQLNWPIPILTVSGLVLFVLGWVLRFGRKKSEQ